MDPIYLHLHDIGSVTWGPTGHLNTLINEILHK